MPTFSYQINRKDLLALLIILALAFTSRVFYFKGYSNTEIYPILANSDGYSYLVWAKDIASGDIWGNKAFMKWPLYAYFLGLLFKVFGTNVTLVYALQFLLGAVNCVLVYFIARRIFNAKIAFLSALLCVWYGLFMFYDGLLVYTSLSLFLNSLLFLFILRIQNHIRPGNLFWAGILLGVCAITQASILIFGVLAVAWILRQAGLGLKKIFYNFSFFAFGLAIVIGAVVLRNYLVQKDFVLIAGNTGFNFYSGNNPEADGLFCVPANIALYQEGMFRDARVIAEAAQGRRLKTSEVSSYWFSRAIAFAKSHPAAYLKLLLRKTRFLFSPNEPLHDIEYRYIADKIGVFKIMFLDLRFILPLAFLGIILNLKRFKEAALLYLVLISLSFSIILFFVTTRYRLSMVPFLAIFASCGAFSLWEALKNRKYISLGLSSFLLLAFFMFFDRWLFNKNIAAYSKDATPVFRYHLNKAVNYNNNSSDYQSAMREVRKAYDIQPDSHYCLLTYGAIYFNMQDFKMAEEKFREAIEVFPLSVDAYYNLGFLYNIERRFQEAQATLEKAVHLDPEDASAHFELGRAYKEARQSKEAEAEFNFALEKLSRSRSADRAVIIKELNDLRE